SSGVSPSAVTLTVLPLTIREVGSIGLPPADARGPMRAWRCCAGNNGAPHPSPQPSPRKRGEGAIVDPLAPRQRGEGGARASGRVRGMSLRQNWFRQPFEPIMPAQGLGGGNAG